MMLTITPYLFYEDIAAAVKWLSDAFGFRESLRYVEPDGTVTHAEVEFGGDTVMLGHFGPGYRNPKHTGHVSGFVYVMVDDVEAHYQRAKAAGATILVEPEDKPYGQRQYNAEDLEGHRWGFAQQVRDVLAEEWAALRALQADARSGGEPAAVDGDGDPVDIAGRF
jgi:uncharacterized glyoxalase superfamily protein PhnB